MNSISIGTVCHQLISFEKRVRIITQHLKENKKDHSALHGLSCILGKYRKVLKYCKIKQKDVYNQIIKHLSIKK